MNLWPSLSAHFKYYDDNEDAAAAADDDDDDNVLVAVFSLGLYPGLVTFILLYCIPTHL